MRSGRAVQFQTSAMMIDQSDTPELNYSMCSPMRPRFRSAALIAPLDGVSRNCHSTPTKELGGEDEAGEGGGMGATDCCHGQRGRSRFRWRLPASGKSASGVYRAPDGRNTLDIRRNEATGAACN